MKTYMRPIALTVFTGEIPSTPHASKWQLDSQDKMQIKDGDPSGDLDAKHSFHVWEDD